MGRRLASELTTGWLGALSRGVLSLRVFAISLTVLSWLLQTTTVAAVLATTIVAGLTALILWRWATVASLLVRRPALLALDAVVGLAFGAAVSPSPTFVYYLISIALLTGMLASFTSAVIIGVLLSAGSVVVLGLSQPTPGAAAATTVLAVVALFPMCVLLTRSMLWSVRERLDESLREQHAAQERGAAAERQRIALDLHDSLGKTLEGVTFSVAALDARLDDAHPARVLVSQLEQDMRSAASQARMLMLQLRHEPESGVADSARGYACRWSERTGVRVVAEVDDLPGLPPALAQGALAMITEALANVENHARATTVRLVVAWEQAGTGGTLRVAVHDDGRGLPARLDLADQTRRGHLGLAGIHQRTASLGGEATIASGPDGTTVTMSVPVPVPTQTARNDRRPFLRTATTAVPVEAGPPGVEVIT